MSREITQAQRDWLEGELAVWQATGLVDDERAHTLLGLYESRESFKERQEARGIFTLMAVAGTLVGLGVLLLVGFNWEQMPAPLKVVAIFGTLIGTHAAGFALRYRLGRRRASELVFFMACLFFGSAIWLLAQVFHIESTNVDALWWWSVAVLPFALLFDTILLHLLFAGLLALWLGFEVFSIERLFWGIPSSGYSVPFLIAPGLFWAYRKHSATMVGIYVAVFAWWIIVQPIAWKMGANPTFFIGAVGSLMLLIAALHGPRSELAVPYRFYGIALTGSTLVLLSFHDFNKDIIRGGATVPTGGIEQMILILCLTAATLVAAYFLQTPAEPGGSDAPLSFVPVLKRVVTRQWLPLALLGLFALLAVLATTTPDPLISTILANIAMVVVALWLIRFGLTDDRSRPFAAGVIYLLLWAVLRYIDLFGEFGGMLGAALMFFLCGAALAGVAFYWQSRKAVSLA
jgi:hypothetical protein